MNYLDFRNFLTSWIKFIPEPLAAILVNQALEKIYDEYNWSFLFAEDYIVTPALIQGYGNVAEFGTTIVVDAATKTILDAVSVNDIPVIGRQIRTISNDAELGSAIYSIIDYNSGTSTLTINQPYLGPNNASAQIEIFKNLFNPPESAKYEKAGKFYYDYANVDYLIDLTQSRKLRVNVTQSQLNKYDLNRIYRGNPASLVPNKVDSNGYPLFEMYPIPQQKRLYKFVYKKKGRPFVEDDEIVPNGLSDQLILSAIKDQAYEWIEVNKSIHAELKVVNAISLKALLMNINNPTGYPRLLNKAIMKDDELFPQSFSTYDDMAYVDFDGLMSPFNPPQETLILNY
jgi:hypothetical protein